MPSKTYVQMYMESGGYNYILKNRLYYMELLRVAYQYLCEHPEKIEEVVKERVYVGKFATKHNSFEWLFLELQIINSWILDETFSGDTMHTILLNTEPNINTPNPIYIPKHIKHRKKGRK